MPGCVVAVARTARLAARREVRGGPPSPLRHQALGRAIFNGGDGDPRDQRRRTNDMAQWQIDLGSNRSPALRLARHDDPCPRASGPEP